MAKNRLNIESNEKLYQIDYKENLAVAMKMLEEINMDLQTDNEINDELQAVDLMQEDLLHMIEFHNFNASEGYNFAKMLQEVRQERRKIKNRLEERTKARQFLKNYHAMFKNPLNQTLSTFEQLPQKQDGRKYRLRALPQLEQYNNLINSKKIGMGERPISL